MRARLVFYFLLSTSAFLPACAQPHAHVAAPSTAAVQGGIDNAQTSNQQAQRYNDVARGISGRIEAKTQVIIKNWDASK